jgi:hypothetical protein
MQGIWYKDIFIPQEFLDSLTEYKLTQESQTYLLSVVDGKLEFELID